MPDRETEITLGSGLLLGFFFGLAVLCAIFFAAGYRMGKRSGATTPLMSVPAVPGSPVVKPAATEGALVVKPNCAGTPEGCGASSPETAPPEAAAVGATPGDMTQLPALPSPNPPVPETPKNDAVNGYIVQVAAVSNRQDAEALVAALRKRQYEVFLATSAGDNLFHVQIGPFGDAKDAEALRTRLVSDGYTPIVKR
jgi:cell division septation protein DedD